MQVRFKPTGDIYAMKILKKSELKRRRQVERTKTERTILAVVKHPFIVELHFAFQNNAKLYMVMDFVQGGDFFTLMRKFKRMNEDWVRIYISEVTYCRNRNAHHFDFASLIYACSIFFPLYRLLWRCNTCMTWISFIATLSLRTSFCAAMVT
jgi:serine/threonine protein kinase